MGKLKGNTIIGTLGNVNFYPYRDKIVVRLKPQPSGSKRTIRRKRSQLQKDQLSRFAIASRFAHRMRAVFNQSFEAPPSQKGFNQAIGHMMHTAIVGASNGFRIDFSRLMIARGKALPAEDVKVSIPEKGRLAFTWAYNSIDFPSAANDRAVLVVYCEETDEFAYTMKGAARKEGRAEMDVSIWGEEVHAWISFARKDGSTADSVYAGKLRIK